jgi:monovalent cation:H+ antiporter, CPA1 family
MGKFTREKIPNTWKHIVLVGGMRGAMSVALIASLPHSDLKNILQSITYGVVLLSLIVQYVVPSKYVKRVFPDIR